MVGQGKNMSNNVAEYMAMCAILDTLLNKQIYGECLIRMDSRLVVQQLNHQWRVKQGLYIPYYQSASHLLAVYRERNPHGVRIVWISRDENGECDTLSKDVLRRMGIRFRLQPEAQK